VPHVGDVHDIGLCWKHFYSVFVAATAFTLEALQFFPLDIFGPVTAANLGAANSQTFDAIILLVHLEKKATRTPNFLEFWRLISVRPLGSWDQPQRKWLFPVLCLKGSALFAASHGHLLT